MYLFFKPSNVGICFEWSFLDLHDRDQRVNLVAQNAHDAAGLERKKPGVHTDSTRSNIHARHAHARTERREEERERETSGIKNRENASTRPRKKRFPTWDREKGKVCVLKLQISVPLSYVRESRCTICGRVFVPAFLFSVQHLFCQETRANGRAEPSKKEENPAVPPQEHAHYST